MNRRRRASHPRRMGRAGLTLVEMTVILSVIVILTTVLVPTVMSHIAQARIVRANQDVRAIGNANARFYSDTGFLPKTRDSIDGRQGTDLVELLVGPGSEPALPADGTRATVEAWVTGEEDLFENHLVHNIPGYDLRTSDQTGWNGPYVSDLHTDPWGNRYMCNIVFLEPGGGAVSADGSPKRAVFVISAGPDGIIQTDFEQFITDARVRGDDIVYRLQ